MLLTILAGDALSSILIEETIEFLEQKADKYVVAKTLLYFKNHKLNKLIENEMENAIDGIRIDESTSEIIKNKDKKYKCLKQGFVASILKRETNDAEWFVTAPPCIVEKLSIIRNDFSNLLKAIRERLWSNPEFNKIAGDDKIQKIIMIEIDDIKKQIEIITQQIQELRSEIDEIKEYLNGNRHIIAQNVPVTVATFVGREKQLDEMDSMIASSNILFITGFGGIGKTELAKAYVKRYKEDAKRKAVWITYDKNLKNTIAYGIRFGDQNTETGQDLESLFEEKMAALSN